MKPKQIIDDGSHELFRSRLDSIINPRHELVLLAKAIDWDRFDEAFGAPFHQKKGRQALPTRLMAGLQIIKYMQNLSDEETCAHWIESPYAQYFCGEVFFQHKATFDRSSMTRWRQRMGEEKLVELVDYSAHHRRSIRKKLQPILYRLQYMYLLLVSYLFTLREKDKVWRRL